ncbi:unnamed protein product [Effrenium voratum]|uniref:Uncharacterized protein n=1 Tax=Effrenium voratum TaxID=2562239 RepID=A0AA36JEV9_9DINO|nr:unnamed protein product [Effrenium voratum]
MLAESQRHCQILPREHMRTLAGHWPGEPAASQRTAGAFKRAAESLNVMDLLTQSRRSSAPAAASLTHREAGVGAQSTGSVAHAMLTSNTQGAGRPSTQLL